MSRVSQQLTTMLENLQATAEAQTENIESIEEARRCVMKGTTKKESCPEVNEAAEPKNQPATCYENTNTAGGVCQEEIPHAGLLEELKALPQWVCWKLKDVNGNWQKIPYQPDGQAKASTTAKKTWCSFDEALDAYNNGRVDGVGFVFTREDNYVGVDVDKCYDPETGRFNHSAEHCLDTASQTYAEWSPSGKGIHIIGKGRKPRDAHSKDTASGVEVYEHKRFFTMTFSKITDRPADRPDDVADFQEGLENICQVFLRKRQCQPLDSHRASGDVPKFTEGNRDDGIFRLAQSLYHKGVGKGEAYAFAERVADYCDPPLDHETARRKVDSAWKCGDPHPQEVIDKLNRYYATVHNNRGILVEPTGHEAVPYFQNVDHLKMVNRNNKVRVEDAQGRLREMNPIDLWLDSKDRRSYNRVVFKPNGAEPDEYNLWRGIQTKPIYDDSKCACFLEHVHKNLAKGDQEVANWILDWMAAIIQDPGGGPKRALVLVGGQGTGKTIIGDYLRRVIGNQHFIKFAQHDHFIGRFNADTAGKILVHCDEATWGGDKKGEGQLKSLITDEIITLERKHEDRYSVNNCAHLLVTSNEDHPVPVAYDDRRFVILRVRDKQGDYKEFFSRFFEECKNGEGPRALYGHLLNRKLKSYDPEQPEQAEKTSAKGGAKSESLSKEGKIALQWVSDGKLGYRSSWPRVIRVSEFNKAAQDTAREMGFKKSSFTQHNKTNIETYLGNIKMVRTRSEARVRELCGLPPIEEGYEQRDTEPIRFYVLPSLEDAEKRMIDLGILQGQNTDSDEEDDPE